MMMGRFKESYDKLKDVQETLGFSNDARAIIAALFALERKLDDVQHEVSCVVDEIEKLQKKTFPA